MARCAGALFFLFLSYYLVKPLRNSQFLKEFPPHFLPWIYLVVSGGSLLVTQIFQWCASRMGRRALVAGTFAWAMLCKVFFFVALPHGGQRMTGLFYLWASVYFLLLVSTLWGCLNERFRSQQGERCFPFIALGATLGNIVGAYCADALSGWGYSTLLWSALALLLSLGLLWPEFDYPVQMPTVVSPQRQVGWLHDRYLRAIAVMVLALAVFSTATDFVTQRRLDVQVGEQVYRLRVAPLWPDGYAEFSALRQLDSRLRQAKVTQLAQGHGLDPAALQLAYESFRDERERRLREIFATTFLAQGLTGVVVLGLICRPFLARFGLGTALTVLPTFALLVLPLLLLPLQVGWIQVVLVCSGALNYSFNNAAKEVLYTATDRRAIISAKPFIEGPLMRIGDVICSLLTLFTAWLVVRQGWPSWWEELLMILPCFALVLLWWILVRQAGHDYQRYSAALACSVEPTGTVQLRDQANTLELS